MDTFKIGLGQYITQDNHRDRCSFFEFGTWWSVPYKTSCRLGRHASLSSTVKFTFTSANYHSSYLYFNTGSFLLPSCHITVPPAQIQQQRPTLLLLYQTISTMSTPTRKSRHVHVRRQKARPDSPRAFEILPVEVCLVSNAVVYCLDSNRHCSLMLPHANHALQIRQSIASYLDDKSITSYRLICRSTKYALDEDEGSFWRTRFLDTYDHSKSAPTSTRSVMNEWFKKQYQCRKRIERQRVDFQAGNTQKEMECLSLLKDLINGACVRLDSQAASLTATRILQHQSSQVQASHSSLSQHDSSRNHCQGHWPARMRISPSLR